MKECRNLRLCWVFWISSGSVAESTCAPTFRICFKFGGRSTWALLFRISSSGVAESTCALPFRISTEGRLCSRWGCFKCGA